MKSPHFLGQGKIDFVEKPEPTPGPGQLMLQVKANALCGSERGQFLGGSQVTPGHETAGIVVAAGPETHTPVGAPGVVYLMDFCEECRNCSLGFTNQCLAKRADMGFNRDGGYGPYELIHENIFFPIASDIPLAEATLLLDIMGTGGHALARAQQVRQDILSLAITGAGPIGLGVLAMARLLFGPEIPIFITDMVPYRLELAGKLGGIPVSLQDGTLQDSLRKGGLGGVDIAIDTSGKAAARQACIKALGSRGVLVCVGHGEDLRLEVSPDLIATERSVLGSEYFCYHELPRNLDLLRSHRGYLRQVITHHFPINEIQRAFELFFRGETGKVIVEQ